MAVSPFESKPLSSFQVLSSFSFISTTLPTKAKTSVCRPQGFEGIATSQRHSKNAGLGDRGLQNAAFDLRDCWRHLKQQPQVVSDNPNCYGFHVLRTVPCRAMTETSRIQPCWEASEDCLQLLQPNDFPCWKRSFFIGMASSLNKLHS